MATLRRRVGFKASASCGAQPGRGASFPVRGLRAVFLEVNVVMPFCARADGEYLPLLESLILQD